MPDKAVASVAVRVKIHVARKATVQAAAAARIERLTVQQQAILEWRIYLSPAVICRPRPRLEARFGIVV